MPYSRESFRITLSDLVFCPMTLSSTTFKHVSSHTRRREKLSLGILTLASYALSESSLVLILLFV